MLLLSQAADDAHMGAAAENARACRNARDRSERGNGGIRESAASMPVTLYC